MAKKILKKAKKLEPTKPLTKVDIQPISLPKQVDVPSPTIYK